MKDSVNHRLKKLTIVIPSFNRQKYLLRQIKYWEDKNAKVIILDGSKSSLETSRKNIPSNINYIHSPISIESRLKIVESLIETPYSVLLSDDEFFIPTALENCILELEKDKEYSVCKGCAIAFDFLFNKVNGYPIYSELENYIVDQSKKEDRLSFHLGNYHMAVLWGVTRTEVFLKMLRAISKGPYASAAVAEMTCSIIGAWEGKIKVLNEVMWLRSFENENIWWSFGNLKFHYWMEMPQFENEFKRFISSIVNEIISENENYKEVRDKIILGLENYSRYSLKLINPNRFYRPNNSWLVIFYKSTLLKIKFIKKKIKFLIKGLIIFVMGKDYWHKPIHDVLNQTKEKNIKVNFEEIEKCIKLIHAHHNPVK